ncbi:hypothetical protein BD560DRAFT_435608 [Blakeslea trispora]|nr:hypothetical protein BD560DRAFT_435608 [Blakeslea trispora]
MYTLTIAVADDWRISMHCKDELQLKLEHGNDLGYQVIKLKLDKSFLDPYVCSDDEVFCLKDIIIFTKDCDKLIADFKVGYANLWSRNNHVDLVGHPTGYGDFISDLHFFNPEFA